MKRLLFSLMAVGTICLHAQQKVGVNKSTPEATVHVGRENGADGNMIIRQTPVSAKSDQPLVWNPSTGEVMTKIKKPYHLIDFTVKTSSYDFVKNFDTKIPTSAYKVIIVDAWPSFSGDNERTDIMHVNPGKTLDFDNKYVKKPVSSASNIAVNPVRKAYMFEEGGTWRMYLDYDSARNDGSGGTTQFIWHVKLLAIESNLVTNLNGKEASASVVDGKPQATFTSPLN
uniref:hypothetical protein n=1 Tax=Ornithobacterium rhinotracheale TaxID=28251 RepID=UPI00129CD625|nr:hypothetical protein [Ornithobacterium rhinotracheale]